jgi:hypothetical protein
MIDKIFYKITHSENVLDILHRVDELVPEFIPDDWEDEFGDMQEAYSEVGRGAAEDQVVSEIIKEYSTDLAEDERDELDNRLKEYWGIV